MQSKQSYANLVCKKFKRKRKVLKAINGCVLTFVNPLEFLVHCGKMFTAAIKYLETGKDLAIVGNGIC